MTLSTRIAVGRNLSADERARRAQRAIQLADTSLATLAFIAMFAQDALRATLGNAVGVGVAVAICLMYSLRLLRNWRKIRWMRMPLMLVLFLVSSGLAVIWSADMEESLVAWAIQLATAGAAIGMTMLLPWPALVKALGTSLRWVLGLGLLVEGISLVIVHGPVLGLTGHLNMLSFAAIVLIVVVPLQLAERTVWRGWAYMWLAIAVSALIYAGQPPTWLTLIALVVVRALIEWTRATDPQRRRWIYTVSVGLLLGLVVSLVLSWNDFAEVSAGGSWVSLIHTSSPVALAFFILVLITSTWRAWFVAVDRPQWDLDTQRAFTATSMLPLLLLTTLITLGTFESVLTLGTGLLLVGICAVVTKYPEKLRGELR